MDRVDRRRVTGDEVNQGSVRTATGPSYPVSMSLQRQSGELGRVAAVDGAAAFKKQLESLVVDLLGRRYWSADDMWNAQLRLLRLQRDIQAAIARRKAGPKRGEKEDLDALRDAMWHARRFGDAYAWVLFKGERTWIDPLAENERVPVPPESHSAQAVTAVAVELTSKGYGFPLLHDITEGLRVGDVTFFLGDERPRTIEETQQARAQADRRCGA